MKRKSLITVVFIVLSLISVRSGAGDEGKRAMNFIAVLDLNCGTAVDKENCTALTNIVIEELVKINKYTVIDRANRDKILAEQGFQQSGCVEERCTVEMGRLLGVGKIVVGSISKIGLTYLVSLQLINVETGAVEVSASEECKCDLDGLIGTVRKASRKLMGEQEINNPASALPLQSIETSTLAASGLFPSFQPGKAMVIFYRPSISGPNGGWVKQVVYDGQQTIGQLASGSYFYYETDPGVHDFKIRHGSIKFSTGNISLAAGQTVFIESGFDKEGKGVMEADQVDPNVGLAEAKKCKYMGTGVAGKGK